MKYTSIMSNPVPEEKIRLYESLKERKYQCLDEINHIDLQLRELKKFLLINCSHSDILEEYCWDGHRSYLQKKCKICHSYM